MSRWLNESAAWWAALPPEWKFLLLLPFFVVAVALLAHWPRAPEKPQRQAQAPAPLRRRHHHRGSR